ncbi:MAG: ABC transporter permease [Phycisphaerales bacterium]
MIGQLFAIARNTFIESIRQPIFIIMIGVGVLGLMMNLGLSTFTLKDDNKLLLDMGMATIFVCGLVIAAFTATSVLAEEIEKKTALTVVSKPVGRPIFIFGKYLGVSAAILVAAVILSIAFMMTVRHEVLQRAGDEWDWPVIVFGFGAIGLAVALGIWGNYFYDWMFNSVAIGALLPLSIIAWLLVLAFDKTWQFQLFQAQYNHWVSPDLDPQMILALVALGMALLVMTAVAIAASARLGQVMTIFVCVGVFMAGLLSDYLFGQRVYETKSVATITEIEYGRDTDDDFSDDGDYYLIKVDRGVDLREGMEVDIAADPVGLSTVIRRDEGSAVQVRNLNQREAELVRIGDGPVSRVPRAGDYLLSGPPEVNQGWRVAWAILPNFQFLILIDPLTQRHIIPLRHMALLAGYSAIYITGLLSLAVILFQTREVG